LAVAAAEVVVVAVLVVVAVAADKIVPDVNSSVHDRRPRSSREQGHRQLEQLLLHEKTVNVEGTVDESAEEACAASVVPSQNRTVFGHKEPSAQDKTCHVPKSIETGHIAGAASPKASYRDCTSCQLGIQTSVLKSRVYEHRCLRLLSCSHSLKVQFLRQH